MGAPLRCRRQRGRMGGGAGRALPSSPRTASRACGSAGTCGAERRRGATRAGARLEQRHATASGGSTVDSRKDDPILPRIDPISVDFELDRGIHMRIDPITVDFRGDRCILCEIDRSVLGMGGQVPAVADGSARPGLSTGGARVSRRPRRGGESPRAPRFDASRAWWSYTLIAAQGGALDIRCCSMKQLRARPRRTALPLPPITPNLGVLYGT